jgi:hypothetical protein
MRKAACFGASRAVGGWHSGSGPGPSSLLAMTTPTLDYAVTFPLFHWGICSVKCPSLGGPEMAQDGMHGTQTQP